ncbi:RloB domain-containing protein [Aestuariivirga sp.]|uniref:RloB domain-containing protein n=1 Tax=Aestuariivirga sp. TaxID=2650926 RepID=UPI0034581EA9|nr:RloB domain-containing protein [Aestuariivirga sp.]
MKSRRPFIQQRKPIFVGCEGESEQSYASFILDTIREEALHVHLRIEVLRAGDPNARLQVAIKKLRRLISDGYAFEDRFVFLDTDQLSGNPQRMREAALLAAEHKIRVIWQEPCFEALLLRHIEGCATKQPLDKSASEKALRREWPNYEKPMSRAALKQKLNHQSLLRAAKVEVELKSLLHCVGLLT